MADPLARLATIRRGLSPAEWTRVGAMTATVVGLNVAGWGMLAAALGGHYHISKTTVFGVGTGALAYTLGMRHAFDADHIAAIDNTTRKLVGEGKRPLSTGFFFSLGHSSVVFALAVLLNFGIRGLGRAAQERRLEPAVHDQHHRHLRVRVLPVPDRGVQRRHPGRHPQGVPRDAVRRLRRRAAGGTAQQARPDEPLPRPAGPPGGHPVEDVPDRVPVRPGLRHRHRGGPAGAGGHRAWSAACRSTPSCRCRSCSPPG